MEFSLFTTARCDREDGAYCSIVFKIMLNSAQYDAQLSILKFSQHHQRFFYITIIAAGVKNGWLLPEQWTMASEKL